METLELKDVNIKDDEGVTRLELEDCGQAAALDLTWNYGETVAIYLTVTQAVAVADWLRTWADLAKLRGV